jgi:hypothetical protein
MVFAKKLPQTPEPQISITLTDYRLWSFDRVGDIGLTYRSQEKEVVIGWLRVDFNNFNT